jgi:hypothetical protein
MIVMLRYRNRFRRWLSTIIPVSVRMFGVDILNRGKPLGCQRMTLNEQYDIGMTQICFAGDKPKPGSKNPYIDDKSTQRHTRQIEILQVVSRAEKEPDKIKAV